MTMPLLVGQLAAERAANVGFRTFSHYLIACSSLFGSVILLAT